MNQRSRAMMAAYQAASMASMAQGRMQAVVDRIAMVERIDNGLVVRFREPVKTKRKVSSLFPPAMSLPSYPGSEHPSEGWKQSKEDDDEEVDVYLLELRAVFCADDAAILDAIKRARRGNEEIASLRRQDALLIETGNEGG
jgi:hypothetical protein